MRTRSASLAVAAIVVLSGLLTVHVSGCSLVGLLGGAIVDANTPDRRLVPTGRVERVLPGDSLVLHLHDGRVVTGRYGGAVELEGEAYRARYEAWRSGHAVGERFPGLGTHVRVGTGIFASSAGELLGFTQAGVHIQEKKRARVSPYDRVDAIRWEESGHVSRGDLLRLRYEGRLPVTTAFEMDYGESTEVLPLDAVAQIDMTTIKSGARRGFVLGLVADALIVATALVSLASWDGPFSGSDCSGTTLSAALEQMRLREAAAIEQELLAAAGSDAHREGGVTGSGAAPASDPERTSRRAHDDAAPSSVSSPGLAIPAPAH